jgi:outer membrane protein TolC
VRLTGRPDPRRARAALFAAGLAAALAALAAPWAGRPAAADRARTARAEESAQAAIERMQRISIDQLLDVTVRRSPGLARARADAGIARAEERTARGRDDWQLQLAIDGARTSRPPVSGQPVQVTDEVSVAGSAAAVRDLPTGGQLRLEASAARREENHLTEDLSMRGAGALPSTSAVSQASARFVLNHAILRGFGPSVARADREQAALRSTAAALRARVAAGEVTRDVVRGYWELAHAALSLEVRRSSLESVRKLYEETQAVVREGARPAGDLKNAEYTLALREESVLRAELALEEQALDLRRLAGLEIGGGAIGLWPADLPAVGVETYSVGELVERGLARNAALAALAQDDQGAAIEVRVARDGVRPRLDVTVSAGATAAGANVDEAFRGLGDGASVDASAGLAFSIDIGGNAARGRRDAALLRRGVVRIEREELRREIASAIVLAVHQIRAAQKRVEVAAAAIELARASLTAERALFRVGRSTSYQLFQHQDDLDEARLSRIRAIADYHEAVAALQSLTGDILARHGIEVLE